ncbi:MAG TPA: beta-ketoacyl synthase chain length factor, partial [Candidatus Sulfotelmatobacter sp.]|nr:beta-ketoacyl synthase chain length factor [Candidatus Sulfotelmatobacter sp.]
RVHVEGIGLFGPGLNGWQASRSVLSGATPYVAAPTVVPPSPLLPPNERRRTVQTVKLALAVGAEAFAGAGRDPAEVATVFTSSGGDGETIHQILDVLATNEPELSPTRFHNSVHNAPAGYWSIANRSHAPSSSLCCYDSSFAAGLIEAAVQATTDGEPVALFAYDVCAPEPLNTPRPIGANFAAALILTPQPTAATLAVLEVEVRPRSTATTMADAALEALRQGTPAARSLPLLAALARKAAADIALDFVSALEIGLRVTPFVAGSGVPAGDQAAVRP